MEPTATLPSTPSVNPYNTLPPFSCEVDDIDGGGGVEETENETEEKMMVFDDEDDEAYMEIETDIVTSLHKEKNESE